MASISKNLERAVGRSINIPAGTDLVALLYTMGSEDRYYTPDITRLTNTNGLPVVSTWYNFTCDDIDPTNKKIYASHAAGYQYVANITISGISKWVLEFTDNTYPVGVPIPFPGTTPPLGYALCNGQSFNTTSYPKLATVYPTGVIPDLRGEFIRGWDNGRLVDSGRSLLSSQTDAIRNITGDMDYTLSSLSSSSGVFYNKNTGARYADRPIVSSNPTIDDKWKDRIIAIDISRSVPTANENRPRNIAYNYIIRMA
jgi:hypothetical protein